MGRDASSTRQAQNSYRLARSIERLFCFLKSSGVGSKRQGWRVSAACTRMCNQRGPMEDDFKKWRSYLKGKTSA